MVAILQFMFISWHDQVAYLAVWFHITLSLRPRNEQMLHTKLVWYILAMELCL